ncbi:hypothetical protein D9M69_680090 [compost metagenome]
MGVGVGNSIGQLLPPPPPPPQAASRIGMHASVKRAAERGFLMICLLFVLPHKLRRLGPAPAQRMLGTKAGEESLSNDKPRADHRNVAICCLGSRVDARAASARRAANAGSFLFGR